MAFHTRRVDFLHKRIVHKKFQLKIPTLSKNDCSATWKPNTYQKYDTCGKVRNVQRYQKYVVILRSFIFIVSNIFKPTVSTLWLVSLIFVQKLKLCPRWGSNSQPQENIQKKLSAKPPELFLPSYALEFTTRSLNYLRKMSRIWEK